MSYRVKVNDQAAINAPFKEDIEKRLAQIIDSGRFIGGPAVEDFERQLASAFGVGYAVGTGNGLDALRLAFEALIIEGYLHKGDRVLVPANTYVASVLAVIHAGLIPVPVDVDPSTMVITAETVARALTPDVKGLMPVHLYGRAAWDKDIKDIVQRHGLIVVEDNAQAIGAQATATGVESDSCFTGALGHAAAFSFYPTKNIGAMGDGGAVTSVSRRIAETVKALGNYGSKIRFDNIYKGYNSRLDPFQAAVVAVKLRGLNYITQRRVENAARLAGGISSSLVVNPPLGEPGTMVWHQYVVKIEGIGRDEFRSKLADAGVETDIHYPLSPFLQPCFEGEYAEAVAGMEAVKLSERIVSLPVSESLRQDEIDYMIETINTIQS